jgi:hypothetical protein
MKTNHDFLFFYLARSSAYSPQMQKNETLISGVSLGQISTSFVVIKNMMECSKTFHVIHSPLKPNPWGLANTTNGKVIS